MYSHLSDIYRYMLQCIQEPASWNLSVDPHHSLSQ